MCADVGRRVQLAVRPRLMADALRSVLEDRGLTVDALHVDLPECAYLEAGPVVLQEDDPEWQVLVTNVRVGSEARAESSAEGDSGAALGAVGSDEADPESIRVCLSGGPVALPVGCTSSETLLDLVCGLDGSRRTSASTPRRPSRRSYRSPTPDPSLTDREQAVLDLLVEGMTTGQMARELEVRPNTVRTHVHNILVKLGAGTRRQAVVRVLGRDGEVVRRFGVTIPLAPEPGPAAIEPGPGDEQVSGRSGEGDRVRVVLASAGQLFREVVRDALAMQPGVEIMGDAGEGSDAISLAERTCAKVALVDLDLRGCDPFRVAQQIRRRRDDCYVLLLAERLDERLVREVLWCGGSGCVLKDVSLPSLVRTIRAVARGELAVPRALLPELLGGIEQCNRERADALAGLARLTAREKEVVALMGAGAPTGRDCCRLDHQSRDGADPRPAGAAEARCALPARGGGVRPPASPPRSTAGPRPCPLTSGMRVPRRPLSMKRRSGSL